MNFVCCTSFGRPACPSGPAAAGLVGTSIASTIRTLSPQENDLPHDPPKIDPSQPSAPAAPSKKKWEKPAIQSGQLFEANSLSCGKNTPTTEQCMQNPTRS